MFRGRSNPPGRNARPHFAIKSPDRLAPRARSQIATGVGLHFQYSLPVPRRQRRCDAIHRSGPLANSALRPPPQKTLKLLNVADFLGGSTEIIVADTSTPTQWI